MREKDQARSNVHQLRELPFTPPAHLGRL